MRAPRTKQGAERQAQALIRKWRRNLAGGLSFGLDWPTVAAAFPDDYARFQELKALYKTLPGAR